MIQKKEKTKMVVYLSGPELVIVKDCWVPAYVSSFWDYYSNQFSDEEKKNLWTILPLEVDV